MAIQLDAIGIVVNDMREALKFYGLLGVPVPEFDADEDHLEATLPSGLRIMFDHIDLVKQINPSYIDPTGHRMGLAFLCSTPAEVDEVFLRVKGAGFEGKSEPWDAFWGQRYAQVVDPDGNVVDLFAPL